MFTTKNLYQNDPAWKSVPLGNQTKETIGSWGCLMTSMTMLLAAAGYEETPATVNQKMKANGGFQDALIIPAVLPVLWPKVTYRGFDDWSNTPAPLDRLDAALSAGKPVIVQVDWNPDKGIQTHWVVLKERKGADYAIYDPYMYTGDGPAREVLLTQRYKYQGSDLTVAISGAVWYDIEGGAATPPEKPKVPVPAEKFTVYVIEDDLALRADPNVGGYLYKRLLVDTALISLEAKAAAVAKIGQNGQWLQVQDPTGQQGYVAAWYVSQTRSAHPAETATTTTTTTATSMILQPTMADLALRSQMAVAPENLIKRLSMTEKLTVVEDPALAITKIGKQGQWIKVRDTAGSEGYVAAWYVKVSAASPTPATTTTTVSTAPLKVKTSVDQVALRNQPVVNDISLIKRYPLNTELTVTESNAEAKIGKNDQWIKVKDAQGAEGYIAAWYVTK